MGKRENVLLLHRSTEKTRAKIKFPVYVQQKLNGVRALIHKDNNEKSSGTLFDSVSDDNIIIESSEGNHYEIEHLKKELSLFFKVFPYITLDGEIYIHNEPLHKIISRIPKTNKFGTVSKPSLPTKDLDFYVFDIKDETKTQDERFDILYNTVYKYINKKDLKHIKFIPTYKINNLQEMETKLNEFIELGYEGLVYRFPNMVYKSGTKSVKLAGKWKKHFETECLIINVYYEGKKDTVEVVKMLLKNDRNDETFIATLGKTSDDKNKWDNKSKLDIYNRRAELLGKFATVVYYERSGKKDVPFC